MAVVNVVTNNKTAVCCYCFLIRCLTFSDQSEPDTFLESESACTLQGGSVLIYEKRVWAYFWRHLLCRDKEVVYVPEKKLHRGREETARKML